MLIPLAFPALTALPVQTIEIPVGPPTGRTIECEEVWRSDPDSEDYVISLITKVVLDDEGNLYCLHSQVQELLKFDLEGNVAGVIARKGEGPGELGRIMLLAFWPPDPQACPHGGSSGHPGVSFEGAGPELNSLPVARCDRP